MAPVRAVSEKPTPLNFKKITCEVSLGQAKEGGLFGGSFVTYKITTSPLGYDVRRKDSDFHYLRKILVRTYPHMVVPPCLSASVAKASPKGIEKRERYYNRFL